MGMLACGKNTYPHKVKRNVIEIWKLHVQYI